MTQLVIITIASSTQVLTILLGCCKVFVHAVLLASIEWLESSNSATRGGCFIMYISITQYKSYNQVQPASCECKNHIH